MNLQVKQNSNNNIEKVEEMAEIVDEEDAKMFFINRNKKNRTQPYKMESTFYRPKQSIVEYMNTNNKHQLSKKKIK